MSMLAIRRLARAAVVAAAGALALAAPAAAQSVIGAYQAFIGQEDLYNSNGVRLSAPWQVLRQDRANFHRFGIQQSGDQGDGWFGSADNRAALEQWIMNGQMSAEARSRIMSGGATVYVEILGSGNRASGVRVTVY